VHQLCNDLIHVLARPFFLAVSGERQLGAEDLNSGKEFFQTRDQREPIDGRNHVILRHVENDLAGHKVLSVTIRHDSDDQVALDALYLAGKHRADADDLDAAQVLARILGIIAATSGGLDRRQNQTFAVALKGIERTANGWTALQRECLWHVRREGCRPDRHDLAPAISVLLRAPIGSGDQER